MKCVNNGSEICCTAPATRKESSAMEERERARRGHAAGSTLKWANLTVPRVANATPTMGCLVSRPKEKC